MERIVCDWTWGWRFSWGVAIALFVAVKFFQAPPITIAYVYFGEMAFICPLLRRARKRHPER
jgi:hypothetical protein